MFLVDARQPLLVPVNMRYYLNIILAGVLTSLSPENQPETASLWPRNSEDSGGGYVTNG